MPRAIACITALLFAPLAVGCVTCDAPFDSQYNANGGVVERPGDARGRVNSAFVPTSRPLPAAHASEDAPAVAANYIQPENAPLPPLIQQKDVIYFGAPSNR